MWGGTALMGGLYRRGVPPGKGSIDGAAADGVSAALRAKTPKPQNPRYFRRIKVLDRRGTRFSSRTEEAVPRAFEGGQEKRRSEGCWLEGFLPCGQTGNIGGLPGLARTPILRRYSANSAVVEDAGTPVWARRCRRRPRGEPQGEKFRTPRFSAKPPLHSLSAAPLAPRPSTDRPRRTAHPPRAPSACYTTSNHSTLADGTPAAPPAATPILQRGPCATSTRSTYQRPTTTRGA